MKLSSFVIQLLLSAATTSAIPKPFQATNAASANISLPSTTAASLSTGHRPPDPPGFKTHIWQPSKDPGHLLNPLAVYLATISCMRWYTAKPWAAPAPAAPYTQPGSRVVITIQPYRPAGQGPHDLTYGHVMLALYAGVAFMSELRVFYTTKIEVTMFGHPVGVIWIAQKPWMVPATETISNQTAHTSTNNLDILSGRSAIEAVPDQGRYTNPAVPRMAMDYTLSRRKVNSEDILTCIMEGLLIIAYDGPGPFSYLNAVSASGAVAMNLHAIITPGGHQRPGPEQFAMSTFLFFLSTFYSVSKRWDDMDFVVLLHDPDRGGTTTPVARAEGFVLKI